MNFVFLIVATGGRLESQVLTVRGAEIAHAGNTVTWCTDITY